VDSGHLPSHDNHIGFHDSRQGMPMTRFSPLLGYLDIDTHCGFNPNLDSTLTTASQDAFMQHES
jgi:hypothetical protein